MSPSFLIVISPRMSLYVTLYFHFNQDIVIFVYLKFNFENTISNMKFYYSKIFQLSKVHKSTFEMLNSFSQFIFNIYIMSSLHLFLLNHKIENFTQFFTIFFFHFVYTLKYNFGVLN